MRIHQSSRGGSRGGILVYALLTIVILSGLTSLAVDYGRVQLAKGELEHAADAAARFGATGLALGTSTASANAVQAAADNVADGSSVVLDPNNDIDFGIWSTTAHTYTQMPVGSAGINAIRVHARRTASRSTGIPLLFGELFGQQTCDVNATAVAMLSNKTSATYTVPATSSPYLAGMPNGSVSSLNNPHNSPDYAPECSPIHVSGITLTPGTSLAFTSVNGGATNDPNAPINTADGDTNQIVSNTDGAENGMSQVTAPINALMGVFLGPNQPSLSAAPASLNFSTQADRDFTTLAPSLQQVFFIGAGVNSDGELQQFTIPQGATRLFLCTMDAYQWNNNVGSYSTTVVTVGAVTLVQ
jgi:Flp pilus assembly protein TadG